MNPYQRKSQTSLGKIYFWTPTIHQWHHLLENNHYKDLVVAYLKKLSDEGLITIYAFVPIAIGMPNHMHMIWEQNKLNGKETPKGSLAEIYCSHFS